ncbi:DNA bridging protein [Streptomyces phage BillNye]|uniref:DNA bridging protein n=2 Tax=Wilnyevirus billnye TaxID=2560486 RepID=A0A2L1IW44_9CAUD|nr:Lsr2-like DNA bridging protein [Streptomyces phage BillNye]AVD99394.1 DNA bridging protein [Streptomyces phage BillNye]QBZ72476.1 Lsr2-like DNA bridging protein [Streptomyces phage Circinus]
MNKRQYLIQLGLAKPGKGRFSAEGKAAIELAISQGIKFDEPVAKPVSAPKPKAPKVVKEKAPNKGSYDAKAIRAWAERTGAIEKGKRGRIPTDVINAYLASQGTVTAPVKRVVTAKPKVREVTVGWTYARRGKNDKPFISEPLVAVSTCGGCAKGVAYCGCSNGPVAPKYLGGEPLIMEKPAA